MGHWGMCLFQGDHDPAIRGDTANAMGLTSDDDDCYHCGKIEADLGMKLSVCARYKVASHCGQDCHEAHWKAHKSSCRDRKNTGMWLNV